MPQTLEVEVLTPPKTKPEVIRRISSESQPRADPGFQDRNTLDLWICRYNFNWQLSAIIYPTQLYIPGRLPELDPNFDNFFNRITYREFTDRTVEELNRAFIKEAGSASMMSHPIGNECYFLRGQKIYEHSFPTGAQELVAKIIKELK